MYHERREDERSRSRGGDSRTRGRVSGSGVGYGYLTRSYIPGIVLRVGFIRLSGSVFRVGIRVGPGRPGILGWAPFAHPYSWLKSF